MRARHDSAIGAGKARSYLARIVWALCGAVCLFTVENLWIDPWVAVKSRHRLPSFVPESLGGAWFFVLLVLGISVTLLVVCQLLLMREFGFARWKKALTGVVVLAAAILSGEWFVATGGRTIVERARPPGRGHTVSLRWQASATKNVRYNVYRGSTPGLHPDKLNSAPIDGLTYTDSTVDNGRRYCYVVRAIGANGQESADSNEALAIVP